MSENKKRFKVYISRKYIHAATIEIEAQNKKEAEWIAYDTIGDYEMSIKSIDEDGDYVEVGEEVGEIVTSNLNDAKKIIQNLKENYDMYTSEFIFEKILTLEKCLETE